MLFTHQLESGKQSYISNMILEEYYKIERLISVSKNCLIKKEREKLAKLQDLAEAGLTSQEQAGQVSSLTDP